MSDADTDELLLVPPDQYLPELDAAAANAPYLDVVDSLIGEVDRLQTRVESIERHSTSAVMEPRHKYASSDDLLRDGGYHRSTYSTPQKPRSKYRIPKSPFTSAAMRPNDYYPGNTSEDRSDDVVEVNGKLINLAEIEQMLEEIEVQRKRTEARIRCNEENLRKQQTYRCGDNDATLPRRFADEDKHAVANGSGDNETMLQQQIVPKGGSTNATNSSSELSQITAKHVPLSQSSHQFFENATFKDSDTGIDMLDTSKRSVKLMSLRELWGGNGEHAGSLLERLEEEKLRRAHCEDLIHELHVRSLEQAERLAVAVQVDKAKDRALLKFNESWEKLTSRIKSLNEENDKLEGIIGELQDLKERAISDCNKKLKHYEDEASKALHLAHANNEKLSTYRMESDTLRAQIESQQVRIAELETSHEAEVKKNQQLNEIVVQKEIELAEGKSVLADSRAEIANSRRAIELCQAEFGSMKAQYGQLEAVLNEKQKTIKELEAKMNAVQADNENLQVLLSEARQEVCTMVESMDRSKTELREFYQKQVEILVQDKLKEFQRQLDKAESSLAEEITKRELSIAKTAAAHIQQITDKHKLEIKLLEEKQREELKFYQMQVQQSQQYIAAQQTKLKQFQERRATLAQQLHRVMEVQWMEALKIINSTKSSPYTPGTADATIDQLQTLKVKSHNNLEEMLSDAADYGAPDEYKDFMHDTPVSSKYGKAARDMRDASGELQKYVQLLLNNQTQSHSQLPQQVEAVDDVNDEKAALKSEEGQQQTEDDTRSKKLLKPPWK